MTEDSTFYTDEAPLSARHFFILAVGSMEQIIGAALSTAVGVVIPMLRILGGHLPSWLQGVMGAAGLVGIGVGSAVIGRLSDRRGYLTLFRLCPVLILAGALMSMFVPGTAALVAGLFIAGLGVGGGYSLDSSYISELMPARWRQFMVGVAKASCGLGFVLTALVCWLIIRSHPEASLWPLMLLTVAVPGLATLLLRIRWAGSPAWLMAHGRPEAAARALRFFLGPDARLRPAAAVARAAGKPGPLWRGTGLKRVIFSGVPWACEGLGVYGFGVFLPVLIMALGLESATADGMARVADSVRISTVINIFVLAGLCVGLAVLRRMRHTLMLVWGFVAAAAGLLLLLAAWLLRLPAWVSVAGFCVFELFLNAGPHLVTFIIPTAVFPVADRGEGSGIAALIGKLGAIAGVMLMPLLLDWGGMTLVLGVSAAVMLAGAAVAAIYGCQLLPE